MEKVIVTTIRVKPAVWHALRRLSEIKAAQAGGRPSASAVVESLIEAEVVRVEAAAREATHAS